MPSLDPVAEPWLQITTCAQCVCNLADCGIGRVVSGALAGFYDTTGPLRDLPRLVMDPVNRGLPNIDARSEGPEVSLDQLSEIRFRLVNNLQ